MSKNMKIKKSTPRNPVAVAMNQRYRGNTIMHDRREERGGDRNIQQEFIEEYEDDCEDDF